jgi:signal transduction histidine kinase
MEADASATGDFCRRSKLPPNAPAWRVGLNEIFAGITWGALILVLMVCVLDAFRDSLVVIVEAPAWFWFRYFWRRLYPTALMALVMMLAAAAALNRSPEPGWRQVAALAAAVLVPCALGVLLKTHLLGLLYLKPRVVENWYYESAGAYYTWYFIRYAALGLLVAAAYAMHRREQQRVAALRQAELDQALLQEQMDEAHLQTLMAQIEPHFLFNTLANVRSLYQSDPATASAMLDNLVRYLAIALPRMRESESTFGREAMLAEAFLNVQKIRMGGRLSYSIDIPPDLADAPLPPMMLLTLVENAIKHGVGPLREGGTVCVRAVRTDGQCSLQVADTGRGFTAQLGSGAGLANIRARLAVLYGGNARLRLAHNDPQGVTATILLPAPRVDAFA